MITLYCGKCRTECQATIIDEGLGYFCAGGRSGRDVQLATKSVCCDGDVFLDSECLVFADALEERQDRLEAWSDDRRDRQRDERFERD